MIIKELQNENSGSLLGLRVTKSSSRASDDHANGIYMTVLFISAQYSDLCEVEAAFSGLTSQNIWV